MNRRGQLRVEWETVLILAALMIGVVIAAPTAIESTPAALIEAAFIVCAAGVVVFALKCGLRRRLEVEE